MYIRFPLLLRNVEDLLHERGIYIRHETVRSWLKADEIRCRQKCPLLAIISHQIDGYASLISDK